MQLFKLLGCSKNPLGQVPEYSESNFILREQFNNTICDQLVQIDESGGKILLHGISGSGKTVALSQAIRLLFEKNYFKPYGCYWVKIGT